jgi:hypothetical protein
MLLHLESDAWNTDVDDEWVTDRAFECYRAQAYTSDHPNFDFMCPTCEVPFKYMSGLLQHIESMSCYEELVWGTAIWEFLRSLRLQF